MNAKFKTFLAMSFICLQVVAVSHTAEAGDHAHTHNGQDCQIYYYCETAGDNVADAPIFIAPAALAATATQLINNVFVKNISNVAPRAPPLA